jgi:prepilin-type processing-associated H-X9-DG protein
VVGFGGLAAWIAIAGAVRAIGESRRAECVAHLGRIGRAIQDYHVAHGHLPAPAISGRDGTPLLSWRVAILPQLGDRSLYDRFRLDEPWDSPHNRALLAEMPPEFACPSGPGQRSGRTGYQVVVGPETTPTSVNTPFEPGRGADLREITDGTSNTVLVVEGDSPVPWTKPDDLQWSPDGPLPRVESPHGGGSHAMFADGSIRFVNVTIQPETLRAVLTINGGELTGG